MVPLSESKANLAHSNSLGGGAVFAKMDFNDKNQLLAFLKEYRPLECSCCDNIFGFQNKVTGRFYCATKDGGMDTPCFHKAVPGHGETNAKIQYGTEKSQPWIEATTPSPKDHSTGSRVLAEVPTLQPTDTPKKATSVSTPVPKPVAEPIPILKPVEEPRASDCVDAGPSKVTETKPKMLNSIGSALTSSNPLFVPTQIQKAVQAPLPKQRSEATTGPKRYMWSECEYSPKLLATNPAVTIMFMWNCTTYVVAAEIDETPLNNLQTLLAAYVLEAKPLKTPPKENEMVVAPYGDGGDEYYRSRVTKINGDSCDVIFVDFGDKGTFKISELYPINEEIMKYPIYGMSVHLERLPVDEKVTLPTELNNLMCSNPFILELVESNKKIVPCEEPFEVKLKDRNGEMTLNDAVRKVVFPFVDEHPNVFKNCKYSPSLEQSAEVNISFIYTPATKFHITAEKDADDLGAFQEYLTNYVTTAKKLDAPPVEGQMVIANYQGDYYRAVVEQIRGDKCKISFVDFGDSCKTVFSEMYPVNEEIMKYPIYGMVVSLAKVPEAPPNFKLSDKLTNEILEGAKFTLDLPKKMQAQLIPGDLESFAVRLWLGKEIFNKTVTEEIENFMG